ncbi:hypothetical protein CSC94_04790 [Zhengella mangrovi]|uniref:Pole-organizing protein PopZ n=2 Tax=Zhengella mangrovi TaxID=1982044 RepID=A0A2G1QSG5_9HYPH|nr:hypothetical protein CSC94_04790 [Zhengella mangrovi]
MAQAGSAQREPSMEEILASIRKIIEETEHPRDEPAAAPAAKAEAPAPAPAAKPEAAAPEPLVRVEAPEPAAVTARPEPQAAAEDRMETTDVPREPDIKAFRDAIADIETRADVPTAAPDAKPEAKPAHRAEDLSVGLTLAEVQRRLAREAEAEAGKPVGMAAELEAELEAAPFADDQPEPAEQAPEAEAEASPAVAQDEAVEPAPDMADAHTANDGMHQMRPALMSPEVGRQVAGTFGELKEAFLASRQKSFDEMAQEMLRPMLQDWLDNNLPVLVEKLVREEIERIARG